MYGYKDGNGEMIIVRGSSLEEEYKEMDRMLKMTRY